MIPEHIQQALKSYLAAHAGYENTIAAVHGRSGEYPNPERNRQELSALREQVKRRSAELMQALDERGKASVTY